jgi:hypothetical protein
MKTIALCLLLVACGKKAEEAPKAEPAPALQPVAPTDAEVAVLQAVTEDAPAADVDPIATDPITITLLRSGPSPTPPVKVIVKVPAGWKQSKLRHEVLFRPASDKIIDPSLRVGVYLDRLDPEKVARAIEDEIARRKVDVAADDELAVVRTSDRPDGKLLIRQIDATKTRNAVYFETICIVTKPGQPFAVEIVGTVRKGTDDAAMIKTYEEACSAMTIVEP